MVRIQHSYQIIYENESSPIMGVLVDDNLKNHKHSNMRTQVSEWLRRQTQALLRKRMGSIPILCMMVNNPFKIIKHINVRGSIVYRLVHKALTLVGPVRLRVEPYGW